MLLYLTKLCEFGCTLNPIGEITLLVGVAMGQYEGEEVIQITQLSKTGRLVTSSLPGTESFINHIYFAAVV